MVTSTSNYLVNIPRKSPNDALYPSLPELEQQLKDWASQHPDRASLVSIGQTYEKRDIWALRIGKAPEGSKPGLLVTGTTHAREWNSTATAMNVARELIEKPSQQNAAILEKGEVWVVPCLNPDGYNYTKETDPNWRKNRRPITVADTGCPEGTCPLPAGETAIGVDLNRNYYDGNPAHFTLYRPDGDTPCNTADDSGPGYDDPKSDNYRGPQGGSENEVRSVLQFFINKPNVKGVVDHHSYGNSMTYPVPAVDPAAERYRDIAKGMNAVMDKPYKVLSCTDIPIPMGYFSGVAPFLWNANGKTAFLIEMGTQFQPDQAELESTVRDLTKADLSFAEYLIKEN
jgi:hypothetical protein